MRKDLVYAFLFSLVPTTIIQAQGPASGSRIDLPVKSVVLFSSGVGYFEHAGTVRGDGSAELRFQTNQINDILKSLMLQDTDGGKIAAVTYPSVDPVDKTLHSFQVDITDNPNMASLLNQLRGAKVTVQRQAERISGTILGVESRVKKSEKGEEPSVSTLNLLSGAMIRSLDLASLSGISLDDPKLQEELSKALFALNQSRNEDKKPVTITFTGVGERHVQVGYVVEAPIWKTSYRLMLDEKGAHMQGWAIVENQTESDWNNVSLSLVSGRPISFITDLYEPKYMRRPTVEGANYNELRPQMYSGGMPVTPPAGEAMTSPPESGGRGGVRLNDLVSSAARRPGLSDRPTSGEPAPTTGASSAELSIAGQSAAPFGNAQGGIINISTRSITSVANSGRLGALFQYAIPSVTLARQKSAMLPIVTDTIGAERVSIYNASVLSTNPLNGVRLKNNTGKHLLQGPVTVLDKESYAGDARIDDIPPGQERLLSYGIDLDVLVDNTKNNQTTDIVTAKLSKGMLVVTRKLVATQEYQVDNKGTRDKAIVIEHPIHQGWKIVESPRLMETLPSLYRFQGTIAAGRVTSMVVKEELTREETVAMLSANSAQLLTYSRTGEIPAAVRDAITKAMQMKQAIADLDTDARSRNSQISDISAEQARMRENMKTVDSKSQYYTRLLTKLNEQESSIERLQKERDDILVKREAQQRALNDYLNSLTIG